MEMEYGGSLDSILVCFSSRVLAYFLILFQVIFFFDLLTEQTEQIFF